MIEKNETFILDEIISIENAGDIDTYDFTVPETHCFFANGVLVHNSGALEEVSDLCLTVAWDYFYTREEEIARDYWIRIAKNRDGRTGVFDNVAFYPEYYRICEKPKPTPKPENNDTKPDWRTD